MKTICSQLFNELNLKNIKYCHFKSNEYLEDGLDGKTDLDVIVEEKQYSNMIDILQKFEFREFEANEFCKYPGVTNWYGMDRETGTIIHIHLHTHLITGKSLIKDYIIPWDQEVLQYSEKSDLVIRSTQPEMELILLFVRLVVKRTIKQRIKSRDRAVFFPKDEWEEVRYLRKRVNYEKFENIYCKLMDKQSCFKYRSMILESDPIELLLFSEFEKLVRSKFKKNRRMTSVKAASVSFAFRLRRKVYIFANEKLNCVFPVKKRCERTGPIFAFVGIDGSGKSTMIKEIQKWIGDEFDVKKFYLGAGQENASIIAKLFIGLYQSRLEKHEGVESTESNMTRKRVSNNSIRDLMKAYVASFTYLRIDKNNLKCLKQAINLSEGGGIALCDRMPQSTMEIQHDGMKVQRYARAFPRSILINMMAKSEKRIFDKFDQMQSNLYVIKMNIDPEISYSRKRENEKDSKERKLKANTLDEIKFKNAIKVINVNCNENYEKVLLNIKNVVWSQL